MENKFDLEYQFKEYLKKFLNVENMPTEVEANLKELFMGACVQILVLLFKELPKHEEEKGREIIDKMYMQVYNYFKNEINKKIYRKK